MARISSMFDRELLARMVEERMVAVKQHPNDDLWILNYTSAAQYTATWNDVTRRSRGLIVRGNPLEIDAEIHARPFEKFFNLSEHGEDGPHMDLPTDRNFTVYGKMDGSLGVLYESTDGPAIATRGSFASEQAEWATKWLRRTIGDRSVPAGVTLLFEIIYPQNRIVVDYGDHEGLTLLAAIENETGADVDIPESWHDWLPCVQTYDGLHDIDTIMQLITASPEDWANHEGFVLRFDPPIAGTPSMRVKAKFSEYVRLHRIITGVSSKTVWEYLAFGKDLAELLDNVPDEFYDWVQQTVADLKAAFRAIETKAQAIVQDPRVDRNDRKTTALFFQTQPHRAVLFKMLDGAPYDSLIWRTLKPAYEKPFRDDVE